jgi:rhamnogalacturonyl hydrolase YesR
MKLFGALALAALSVLAPLGAEPLVVGLTASYKPIESLSLPGRSPALPTVLVIGGLDGDARSADAVRRAAARLDRRRCHVLAIPLANPEKARLVFPPTGAAYKENPESHYLWRWIGVHAPDLVLVAGADDSGLAAALSGNAVAGMGRIPARRVSTIALGKDVIPPSEARRELDRRRARTPRQVAEELAVPYGHEFPEAVYIPAMALIGRLRLGQTADVERLAAPFATGAKDSLAKAAGSHLAGHLLFAELAARTGDARYTALVRKAADLGFTPAGEMREAMPYNVEMSDAVFMGCPILAAAGRLTGEPRYFDMVRRHLEFMQKLCLRPDGLYRNSPLTEAAWGRGNAFPALGLAWTLGSLPPAHPAFAPVLRSFQNHMAVLAKFQDPDGLWRQVIDHPGAYPEFTATAMIAVAMLRGVRAGWLDEKLYRPRIERAWRAVNARIGPGGILLDVCEGTGKQRTLADYLHRIAIFGKDPRGGGMALLFATEMME